MITVRTLLFQACISMSTFCLLGMEIPVKPTTQSFKASLNMPYFAAKIGALLLDDDTDSSSTDSSQEEIEGAVKNSLIQREIISIGIDSLELATLPLTINGNTRLLKELCDPKALIQLLHTLHRDSYTPQSKASFAQYLQLLTPMIQWDALKAVLSSDTYLLLTTLMQKTGSSVLTAEEYQLLFETVAKALGFPFESDIDLDAYQTLCNDLAGNKRITLERVLACFTSETVTTNTTTRTTQPYHTTLAPRALPAFIGLLQFAHDCTTNSRTACAKAMHLYLWVRQQRAQRTSQNSTSCKELPL